MAVVKAGADGKAPKGLSAGDSVLTNGGTYRITGVNPDGTYQSVKVNDLTASAGNGAAMGVNKNDYGGDPESQKAYVNAISKNAGYSYYDPNNPAANVNGIVDGTGVDIYGFDTSGNFVGSGLSGSASGSSSTGSVGGGASGVSSGVPDYQVQGDHVNKIYDAAKDKTLAALEQAYEKSKLSAEAAKEKIPAIYQQQANAAAAQAEKAKQAFNEYAAGAGLSSGAAGQATLAQGIGAQRDQTNIRTAQGNALADMELQLAQLHTDYQFGVQQALAENEYERAAALLAEYQRQSENAIAQAQAQAEMDYRYYVLQMEQEAMEREMALEQAKRGTGGYTAAPEAPVSDNPVYDYGGDPFFVSTKNALENIGADAAAEYLAGRVVMGKISQSKADAIAAQLGL